VGLRWWSEIKEDGTEKWIFESKDNNYRPNSVDSAFFWTAQIAASGVWVFFLVLNILSFTPFWVCFSKKLNVYWSYKAIVDAVAFLLCGINFMGFYKCRGGTFLNLW
jgi:hypothetical protein